MNFQLLASTFLLILVCIAGGKPRYWLRQSSSHVQHPQSMTMLNIKERSVRKLCGGKSGKSGKNGKRRSLEDVCDDDYYFSDDGDVRTFPPMGKGKGKRGPFDEGVPATGESTVNDDLTEPVAPLTGEDPLATIAPGISSDDDNTPTEDDIAPKDDVNTPEEDDDEEDGVGPDNDDRVDDGTDDGSGTGDDDISISNEDLGISGFPDDDFSISNTELGQTDDEVSNDPFGQTDDEVSNDP